MIRHLRFHGRGGEGVKLASRIVSRAAFLHGFTVQDSPLYGAERRGAPVVAFVRLSDEPIHERGYIERPDVVVVMDDSLLAHPEAAVLDGVSEPSVVLANTSEPAEALQTRYGLTAHMVTLDISSVALEILGHHLLSAPVAGFTVKATGVASWEEVAKAVAIELDGLGVAEPVLARNVRATRWAFEHAPAVHVLGTEPPHGAAAGAAFVIPRLPARIAAPSISVEATSALRTTEGWRVYRPVIDLARCTRCFYCFALCPEGAIRLDAQNYPVVDYDHCKGCLVCVSECAPKAIAEVREVQHGA
jgi:pyruvate ferredoxin oxidoreductase gamma subunit